MDKINYSPKNLSITNIEGIVTINNNSNLNTDTLQNKNNNQRIMIGSILENIENENMNNNKKYLKTEDNIHKSSQDSSIEDTSILDHQN